MKVLLAELPTVIRSVYCLDFEKAKNVADTYIRAALLQLMFDIRRRSCTSGTHAQERSTQCVTIVFS